MPLFQTIDMGLGPIPRAAHNPFPFLAERKGSPLHLQRASSSLGWTDIAQGGQRERIEYGKASCGWGLEKQLGGRLGRGFPTFGAGFFFFCRGKVGKIEIRWQQ